MEQLAWAKIIPKLNSLPLLPHVVNRVIELADDPKADTQELCLMIGQDQVLVSKVLKLVNSAYYGLPRKIGTISEAVTILGMQTIKTVVIGASIYSTLNSVNNGSKQEQFWRHSVACAAASRIISIKTGLKQGEQTFVAGLIHDIGKIILTLFMPAEYVKVTEITRMGGKSVFEAEKDVLGFTHAEIGRFIAEKWNLPGFLVDTIGGHHDRSLEGENADILKVVYLANAAADMAGYGSDSAELLSINHGVLSGCNLTYRELCMISEEIKGKISIDFL